VPQGEEKSSSEAVALALSVQGRRVDAERFGRGIEGWVSRDHLSNVTSLGGFQRLIAVL
jgi:hypothetical protein